MINIGMRMKTQPKQITQEAPTIVLMKNLIIKITNNRPLINIATSVIQIFPYKILMKMMMKVMIVSSKIIILDTQKARNKAIRILANLYKMKNICMQSKIIKTLKIKFQEELLN